jgi:hypothetical protein
MNDSDEKAKELWGKFYILTQEMLKFIERDNTEMFLQLLEQRLRIQQLLEELDNKTWTRTAEGQVFFQKISPLDMQIQYKARCWLNKTKQSQDVARAYDSLGDPLTGNLVNRSF